MNQFLDRKSPVVIVRPAPQLKKLTAKALATFFYQATAIAVAIRFPSDSGSRNFQPNAINWS
jgi:hypothetical protein